jgi:hypothetical protein
MRKSVLAPTGPSEPRPSLDTWLDLEHLASLEISSEDPAHPFEDALRGEQTEGWHAADPGRQTIVLKFDEPRSLRRIRLEFREARTERSQEFAISVVTAGQKRQVVRQQFTFSPSGATTEVEDFSVSLPEVSVLELMIDPGRHNQEAFASLQSIALA